MSHSQENRNERTYQDQQNERRVNIYDWFAVHHGQVYYTLLGSTGPNRWVVIDGVLYEPHGSLNAAIRNAMDKKVYEYDPLREMPRDLPPTVHFNNTRQWRIIPRRRRARDGE